MSHNEPIPYSWEMSDPLVLAHRFALPEILPPYTSVTVAPGQNGLVFINSQVHLLKQAGLTLLTADLIHNLATGHRLTAGMGEAILPYNTQITLFDMRQKLWPAETIDLTAANGEHAVVSLSIAYAVNDPEKLDRCGASYQPCTGGSQMRQDDPKIAEAFRRAVADVANRLQQRASALPAARDVIASVTAPAMRSEVRSVCDGHLSPLGLQAAQPHLSPTHTTCPYCQKPLSFTEIRRRFCSAVDDEGQPQKGCNRRLHACPSCQTLVGFDRRTCPSCETELLYCSTPGCETYRRVERGRFCTVCKRACYPRPNPEFLTLI